MTRSCHPTPVILTKEEPVLSAVEGISPPQRKYPLERIPKRWRWFVPAPVVAHVPPCRAIGRRPITDSPTRLIEGGNRFGTRFNPDYSRSMNSATLPVVAAAEGCNYTGMGISSPP
jgi:hypothetical protein